jgi:hypothetical protein
MDKNLSFYLLGLSIIFNACISYEEIEQVDARDYQPLHVGNFWYYQVNEEFTVRPNEQIKNAYLIKDIIGYSYKDAENNEVFVLERFKVYSDTTEELQSTYSLKVKNNHLIQNFNNTWTVLLKVPPIVGVTWDAMIYAAVPKDLYQIKSLGAYKLGDRKFEETVFVEQQNEDDKITVVDKRYLIFARGVGLVEQYAQVQKYCSRNDCLGKHVIESGSITHLKLIRYGKI